jgi:hypothetical protein
MFILLAAGFSTRAIIFGFVLSLILSPVLWKLYESGLIYRYKKDVLRHNTNKLGVFTLNLSEEEMIKKSHNLTEKIQWKDLNRFKEDNERYFLYFSDLNAITIKKEPDDMNEEEIGDYQSFIKRKIIN